MIDTQKREQLMADIEGCVRALNRNPNSVRVAETLKSLTEEYLEVIKPS